MLRHQIPRVGDRAGDGTGRHGQRAGQEHLRFLVAHAAGEVAVGRADAAHRRVQPAEGVARPAQAGGARRLADLGAGRQEDLFQRLAVERSVFRPAAISLVAGTTKVSILTVLPLRMLAAARKSVILPPVQEPM